MAWRNLDLAGGVFDYHFRRYSTIKSRVPVVLADMDRSYTCGQFKEADVIDGSELRDLALK